MFLSIFFGCVKPWIWSTSSRTSMAVNVLIFFCNISFSLQISSPYVSNVPVSSISQSCSLVAFLTFKFLARRDRAWRSVVWLVVCIHPLCLSVWEFPSTSINLITWLNLLRLQNLLAQDWLCWPQEVFPLDLFVHIKVWSFSPPLDAMHCAPPMDEEG